MMEIVFSKNKLSILILTIKISFGRFFGCMFELVFQISKFNGWFWFGHIFFKFNYLGAWFGNWFRALYITQFGGLKIV